MGRGACYGHRHLGSPKEAHLGRLWAIFLSLAKLYRLPMEWEEQRRVLIPS